MQIRPLVVLLEPTLLGVQGKAEQKSVEHTTVGAPQALCSSGSADDSSHSESDVHSPSESGGDGADDPPERINKTSSRRIKTTLRILSSKQNSSAAAARAAGKARVPFKTNSRSVSALAASKVWQASGMMRAPTLKRKLPLDTGGVGICGFCEPSMDSLAKSCEPALLTSSEERKRATKKRRNSYHYTRLRLLLMRYAFDHLGNWMYHSRCQICATIAIRCACDRLVVSGACAPN